MFYAGEKYSDSPREGYNFPPIPEQMAGRETFQFGNKAAAPASVIMPPLHVSGRRVFPEGPTYGSWELLRVTRKDTFKNISSGADLHRDRVAILMRILHVSSICERLAAFADGL